MTPDTAELVAALRGVLAVARSAHLYHPAPVPGCKTCAAIAWARAALTQVRHHKKGVTAP